MTTRNQAGAQKVDAVLSDEIRLTLMEEYEAGRIRPAGALAYLKAQGINTGGIDRMDVSDWLKAAVAPAPEPEPEPEEDDDEDEEEEEDDETED